jgi:hypothetical protein
VEAAFDPVRVLDERGEQPVDGEILKSLLTLNQERSARG